MASRDLAESTTRLIASTTSFGNSDWMRWPVSVRTSRLFDERSASSRASSSPIARDDEAKRTIAGRLPNRAELTVS